MGIEIQILNLIQNLRTSFGDFIMPLFSFLGDKGFIWILLTMILLLYPKTRTIGIVLMIALLLDLLLCNIILKPIVARVRPYDVNSAINLIITKPKDFSFPSGHTAASFAVVSSLFLMKAKKIAIPSLILGILIAFSRMYLYVHYPTDILGGIILGNVCGIFAYKLFDKYLKKKFKIE